MTGLLGQKEASAFRVLLAAYISLQQNEQSITVFNQVCPFPHSVTPAPQITSRRCFCSRSTGAVRYLQPPSPSPLAHQYQERNQPSRSIKDHAMPLCYGPLAARPLDLLMLPMGCVTSRLYTEMWIYITTIWVFFC